MQAIIQQQHPLLIPRVLPIYIHTLCMDVKGGDLTAVVPVLLGFRSCCWHGRSGYVIFNLAKMDNSMPPPQLDGCWIHVQ